MKFNKSKCKSYAQSGTTPCTSTGWRLTGVLVDNKLTMGQQCILCGKGGQQWVHPSPIHDTCETTSEAMSAQSWAPQCKKGMVLLEEAQQRDIKDSQITHCIEDRLSGPYRCSLEKRRLMGGLSAACDFRGHREARAKPFSEVHGDRMREATDTSGNMENSD